MSEKVVIVRQPQTTLKVTEEKTTLKVDGPGFIGPQGEQGETGPQGPQGIKGDTGNVGPQGIQGVKGDQGLQGIQGIKGDKGDKGDQGIQGLTGPQGPQGIKGDTGSQGPVGLTGPQGLKGDKGDTGATGATGAGIGDHLAAVDPHKDRLWAASRGDNLFVNGSGVFNTNYNMSGFTFDATETHGGNGSFSINVAQQSRVSDEAINIDPTKGYTLSLWAKSGNADGSMFAANNSQSVGFLAQDASGTNMDYIHRVKYYGSVNTRLAVELKPGDTTMTLEDATGWYNGASATQRYFAWWPYTNQYGYTFPDWTYSRNTAYNPAVRPLYGSGANSYGAWQAGGVVGNVITLTAPWLGETLPVGTAVQNVGQGGTYLYSLFAGKAIPNQWTQYTCTMYGQNLTKHNTRDSTMFPPGCARVRLLWLVNYHGAANNIVRYSDITFTEHGSLAEDATARFATLTAGTHYVASNALTGEGTYYLNAAGGNVVVVLPAVNEGPMNPFKLTFVRTDNTANTITFARGGTASLINGVATLTGHMTTAYSSRTFSHDRVNWYICGGMGA